MLDLDETLVHCITNNIEKADIIVNVNLNTGETVQVLNIVLYLDRLESTLDLTQLIA